MFGQFAPTPWNIPDQRSSDQGVTFADKDVLFIFDLGYFKVKALASMATAGASFFCRRKHQTHLDETIAGHLYPVNLAGLLTTVEQELPLLEQALCLGATEGVASRLIAVRMPEAIVNARRRIARTHAKKKG